MYKIRHGLSRIQTPSVSFVVRRTLARGRIAALEKKAKVIPEFDEQDSILDKESSSNYLGIDEKNDHEYIHGGSKLPDEYKKDVEKQVLNKYSELLKKNEEIPVEGKKRPTFFGHVRLDSDNPVGYHGQYENKHEKAVDFEGIAKKLVNIKIQIPTVQTDDSLKSMKKSEETKLSTEMEVEENFSEFRVENQNKIETDLKIKKLIPSLTSYKIEFKYPDKKRTISTENQTSDWREQCFEEMENREVKNAPKISEILKNPENAPTEAEKSLEKLQSTLSSFDNKDQKARDWKNNIQSQVTEISALDYLKRVNTKQIKPHYQKEYDVLNDLRKKAKVSIATDSKGFNILSSLLPDFSKSSNDDVINILHNSIVYQNEDFIAINKPYGIYLEGQHKSLKSSPRKSAPFSDEPPTQHVKIDLCMQNFLPGLAFLLKTDKLYPVHRLDRDTTGLLVMAKNQKYAQYLHEQFAQRTIVKQYLAITKCVPTLNKGLIDIPIEEGFVVSGNGKKRIRSVLCPEIVEDIRKKRRSKDFVKRAVTYYEVLQEKGNAALVLVKPETGIKHQIRVHLGFGLRCPILGDHKYSSLNDVAPQKLPADILSWLNVRQQKSRYVPMNLHAYEMFIPKYSGNMDSKYYLKAPVPFHFKWIANKIGLKLP